MSKRASSSALGATVLILAVILGGLFGFLGHKLMTQGTVPQYHAEIAEQIKVYDIDYNTTLTCIFIRASKTPMLSALEGFTPQVVDYDLSEWGFYTGKDPNAYMNIWGPASDGKTFSIEICKMCGNTLQVVCPDGEFILEQENALLSLVITVG